MNIHHRTIFRRISFWLQAYIDDRRGTAAMELMIISGPILMLLFNVVDVGTYTYQRMQVEEAAQIGHFPTMSW